MSQRNEEEQMRFEAESVSTDRLYELAGFLKEHGKCMAVKELTDFIRIVEDVDGDFTPELVRWSDRLGPVLEAAEYWMQGDVKERMFDIRWREYLETV